MSTKYRFNDVRSEWKWGLIFQKIIFTILVILIAAIIGCNSKLSESLSEKIPEIKESSSKMPSLEVYTGLRSVEDVPTSISTPEAQINSENDLPVGIISENGIIDVKKPPIEDYDNIPDSYFYAFEIEVPSEPRDEVVIESLDVRQCVARGFVHNLSNKMFARNVVVTLKSLDGVDSATWHWPLTIMPGERAPFEIAIDWVPSRLLTDSPDFQTWNKVVSRGVYRKARSLWREPIGNISSSVTFDLSTDIDISRAFGWDIDRSEILRRNYSQTLLTFDERLYEFEEGEEWFQSGRDYNPISRELFEQVYPSSLVVSADLDIVASEFHMLQHSDLYFIPERVFPQYYDDQFHTEVDNIRVFRAITESDRVLDVTELIPFKVIYGEDNDGMRRQIVAPQTSFINFDSGESTLPAFVVITTPKIYTEIPGETDILSYSRNTEGQIWVGTAKTVEPLWNITQDIDQSAADPLEAQDWPVGSCDRSGGLTKEDFEIVGGARADVFDVAFGYYGLFNEFESYPELSDSIIVDRSTVSTDNGFVRGFIHNVSDGLFARNVKLTVTRKNISNTSTTWLWPLTVQPGEHAPFEVYIGGWEGSLSDSQFDLQVSAALSEQVDISRSFRIHLLGIGSVYAEEADARLHESSHWSRDYRGYTTDDFFGNSLQHLSLEEFEALYGQILCFHQIEQVQLDRSQIERKVIETCDNSTLPFSFVDLYAQIAIPDSHPTLSGPIGSQAIDDLRAYVAIIDENGVVRDVKDIVGFTSVFSNISGKQEYIPVNRIPSPNLLQPDGVRLLFTRPQFAESWLEEEGYAYQVWIGGAVENTEQFVPN